MKSVRILQSTAPTTIPLFLAPAFAESSIITHSAIRSFSSTTRTQTRGRGHDRNKRRGESVIRSTGPRRPLRVQMVYRELPKPRAEEDRPLKDFPTNPNHGLYGFFNEDKETVIPGEREEQHGRSWTLHELAFKSFADLHTIYWKSLLEVNRVKTRILEHQRLRLGFGSSELHARLHTVESTISHIRQTLKRRQEAWEEAKVITERNKTMTGGLEKYLADQESRSEASRIEIVTDPSQGSSVPEERNQARITSVPEELPSRPT